jgi:hypothetical protein
MSIRKIFADLSKAGWIALIVLLAFLIVSLWFGIAGWRALGDVEMTPFGWFALIAGSFVTVGLGAGLMALVFYSSRHDMDR